MAKLGSASAVGMCTVSVNATPAEKIVAVGLLALVSVVLATQVREQEFMLH